MASPLIFLGIVLLVLVVVWSQNKSPSERADSYEELPPGFERQSRTRTDEPTPPSPRPPTPPREDEPVAEEIRPWVAQLSSTMPRSAVQAAEALGESGHSEAVLPLVRQLSHSHRGVRFAVVEALHSLAPESAQTIRTVIEEDRLPGLNELMQLVLDSIARVEAGEEPIAKEKFFPLSERELDSLTEDYGK